MFATLGTIDFELLADWIPHIVWTASAEGSTEYFNRLGTEYTGQPSQANYGWDWLDLVHPDDMERARTAWERAFATGSPDELEYRIRRWDGEYRWMAVRGVPIHDGEGQIFKWIGTCTDVEERHSSEQRLHDANRRTAETLTLFDTLLATAPVGCCFVDRDFRFVHVNARLAAINGPSVKEHLGRTVAEVVPDLWPQIEPFYRRVLDEGREFSNVEVTGDTDGEPGRTGSWLVSYYPVRLEDEIIGIGVVVVDITERKEAEEAQRQLTHSAVEAIAATVEARDPYTAGHERRVADIAAAIAVELGVDDHSVEGIKLAAHIHDVGKISIPSEILARPGALRPAEFELIKGHPRAGADIIAGITFPWPIATMILQHHERFDGSGYPDGVRGDELLIGARIIAVADVLEAMSSHRPYRPTKGLDAALDEIRSGRGTLFDPEVVDACLRLFAEGRLPHSHATGS